MMATLKWFALISLVCISKINFGNAMDFPNHRQLDQDGKFQLYWAFDNDTITFKMQVASKGWAGLGFSPNGGMEDADIVTFGIDASGNKFISDRHAKVMGYPPEDIHQDYFLLDLVKSDGTMNATFTRKRNTCDPDDWPLTTDTTRVIFAMNDEIPADKDSIKKHTYKSAISMQFFSKAISTPDGQPPEAGAVAMDFKVDQVKVPDDMDTLYYCKILPVPVDTKQRHIIKIEPVIQKENVDVVHHIIVYICTKDADIANYTNIGHACYEPETAEIVQKGFGNCQGQTMTAWAVGGQSVTYPKNVGMPLHNVNENMYLMMQVHYNNPTFQKGRVDSSGMRVWLTENLRPVLAGQVQFGSPVGTDSVEQILPPQMPKFTTYTYCTAECTSDLPAGGINLLGGLLHTHLTGRKIKLLHYRNYVQLPDILADNHYDFNYQDYRREDEPVVILPGDDIVMECEYDTTGRTNTTFSGLPTHDEMCLAYVDYYPAVYNGFSCLSSPDLNLVFPAIGYDPKKIPDMHGKNVYQYLREDFLIDWSFPGRRELLQNVVRNGKHYIGCYKNPINASNPSDGGRLVVQTGYPFVLEPLVPNDECPNATETAAPTTFPVTTPVVVTTSAPATVPPTTGTTHTSSAITYKKTSILLYFFSFMTVSLCYVRL